MNFEKTTLDNITIVGIAVRTTNKNQQAQSDIAKLWESFFTDNILQNIPNRLSDDVYCIYTDYESDYMGAYTTIIGCPVSQIDNLPNGFVKKEIPTCNYNKYISEGEIPNCVGKTWAHIWQSTIDRKYLADFDVYGKEAQDPKNAKVTTYLSIQ